MVCVAWSVAVAGCALLVAPVPVDDSGVVAAVMAAVVGALLVAVDSVGPGHTRAPHACTALLLAQLQPGSLACTRQCEAITSQHAAGNVGVSVSTERRREREGRKGGIKGGRARVCE